MQLLVIFISVMHNLEDCDQVTTYLNDYVFIMSLFRKTKLKPPNNLHALYAGRDINKILP